MYRLIASAHAKLASAVSHTCIGLGLIDFLQHKERLWNNVTRLQ